MERTDFSASAFLQSWSVSLHEDTDPAPVPETSVWVRDEVHRPASAMASFIELPLSAASERKRFVCGQIRRGIGRINIARYMRA